MHRGFHKMDGDICRLTGNGSGRSCTEFLVVVVEGIMKVGRYSWEEVSE